MLLTPPACRKTVGRSIAYDVRPIRGRGPNPTSPVPDLRRSIREVIERMPEKLVHRSNQGVRLRSRAELSEKALFQAIGLGAVA